MNRDTTVNIEALHDAIEADIKAQFPALETVEFYRENRKGLALPACLLELTEFEADAEPDPGTGQLSVTARFEAMLVIDGLKVKNAKRSIRTLATNFAAWLRLRRWTGQKSGPAQVIGAYKDDFNPELDQFEVWRVEWTQILHLGTTDIDDGGVTPIPYFSWSPDIGEGHEDDYTPAVPPAGGTP